MNSPRAFLHQLRAARPLSRRLQKPPLPSQCPACRQPFSQSARRPRQAADDPDFLSIVDHPPNLVRAGRKKHGPGLIILGVYNLSPQS
jgi:surfeit locus 1 family protein